MAITILGASRCPLCGGVIAKDHDFVATSHFITDKTDPLMAAYSDATMHRACFLAWPHREEFVAKFNATMRGLTRETARITTCESDGTILTRRCENT